MIRNLLFNCFAPHWSDEWRLNVERLCEYADTFTGRKLVLIKTGPDTVHASEVAGQFARLGNDVEFLQVQNDPALGEVTGFADALSELASVDPNEATFYAHTKGTKYRDHPDIFMRAIRRWRNRMYHECLSDPARIDRVLGEYACCGCFQRPHHALLGESQWHFAGSFWWVNHARLFTRDDWHEVDQTFYGTEAYLGYRFPVEDTHCLYQSNRRHNLYATRGHFRCLCGHEFEADMKLSQQPIKVCRACSKRRASFVGLVEMEADAL